MPQEGESTGQEPAAPEPKEGQEPQGEQPKTFDEDYVKTLRAEAAKYRTEAQEAKAKAQEFEDRDKSELEKASNKLSKAEERAQTAEGRLLRFRVAAEKQLPADLIDRLQGSSEEELAADADKLLALVKKPDSTPEFDGGAREPAPEPKSPEEAHNETLLQMLGLTKQT